MILRVYIRFCLLFPKLNCFSLPLYLENNCFSKIKLLFVTPLFENNRFFHKFNYLNNQKAAYLFL